MLSIMGKIWDKLDELHAGCRAKMDGVEFGPGTSFLGRAIIQRHPHSRITIGSNGLLISSSWRTALGVNHPVVIRTFSADASITIGDDFGMSGGSICSAVSVVIGNGCLIGANVVITDTDFHPLAQENRRYSKDGIRNKPVVIEDNVFLGTGVIVLKGVTIGKGSVIGAGAVVAHSIPSGTIAAGNPCRVFEKLAERVG